jgi:hypothetical protein
VTAAPFTLNGVTALAGASNTTNLTVYTTASVTPTANRLVLVWVFGRVAEPPPDSVTGNGITYSQVASSTDATSAWSASLWAGSSATPSAGAVTITFPAGRGGCLWRVEEWDGSSTPAVRQFKTGKDTGNVQAASITLDASPQASSAVVAGFMKNVSGSFTPGSDFTAGLDVAMSTPTTQAFTEYDIGPVDAVADCSWATFGVWVGVAAEIGAP